jgi:hypothetical protein
MEDFKNISLIVTENTEQTATAQIAVLVNHRRVDDRTVEASFAAVPAVIGRGGNLDEAVERLLERSLPLAFVERRDAEGGVAGKPAGRKKRRRAKA